MPDVPLAWIVVVDLVAVGALAQIALLVAHLRDGGSTPPGRTGPLGRSERKALPRGGEPEPA